MTSHADGSTALGVLANSGEYTFTYSTHQKARLTFFVSQFQYGKNVN